jgi:hypothetical protein
MDDVVRDLSVDVLIGSEERLEQVSAGDDAEDLPSGVDHGKLNLRKAVSFPTVASGCRLRAESSCHVQGHSSEAALDRNGIPGIDTDADQ